MTTTTVDTEALQVTFDTAVGSMNFGSGFLDLEEVTALREVAEALGVDPWVATPSGDRKHFYSDYPVYDRIVKYNEPAWSEYKNAQRKWHLDHGYTENGYVVQ